MLKLLASREHGAMIAAPTFGLPEVDGDRVLAVVAEVGSHPRAVVVIAVSDRSATP